jgi:hypothetical protein
MDKRVENLPPEEMQAAAKSCQYRENPQATKRAEEILLSFFHG